MWPLGFIRRRARICREVIYTMSDQTTGGETTKVTELFFNGIDGDSGSYDLPPMTAEELAGFIRGEASPGDSAASSQQGEGAGRGRRAVARRLLVEHASLWRR